MLLNGNYSSLATNQENYNYYSFYKNGLFDYHSGASLGDDKYGNGHYFIKKDSLILQYDLTDLKDNSYHKFKNYINTSDSIILKINIYNLDKKRLAHVSVLGSSKERYGVESNGEGIAYLKFKKEKGSRKIEISDLCCGNYSFKINSEFNYEVDVFLRKKFNKPTAIKNEVEKYKIIEHTDTYIELKKNNQTIKLIKQL
ncbi:hypothetical protein [Winogradskyella bathintestinalis]|uniref:Uncharacterized protein n=1 Tax=Winogradskyella bathintestinalis TaxID=3035208 RepID=A0ABT7ZRH5_9FLAO|nr:hypothetical protein [Winogradskyella bathintestinalis]MDN3491610.1 hypothetical protein [Winogradskyella bathintestinalis]